MKTIKIFLASSEELAPERDKIADLVNNLNFKLRTQDISVQLVKWEYLDSSMGSLHKQEEYNKELRDCELCMVLYWTRFGIYTKTELDTAYSELCAGRNPRKLYVYFKDGDNISPELKEFKDGFPEKYGHFFCSFQNIDTLKADFLLQFMEYLNVHLKGNNLIEIKDSQVTIDGKVYVNLQNVPFAGNNEEYNLLVKSIKKTKKLLSVTEPDDPEYSEYAKELLELEEKQAQMETSLWDTALMVTKLSTSHCSERLKRAMELFGRGDNKGAQAILNEEDIDKDVEHNLHLIELGQEGEKGIETNIQELKLRIQTLENEMAQGWMDEILSIRQRVLAISSKVYGERSVQSANAYSYIGFAYESCGDYKGSIENRIKSMKIMEELFGTHHPDTATSYNNVGLAYGELGNHKKALEYEIKALKITEELVGTRHPDTATSYDNVGCEYGKLGNHKKALEYEIKALEIREELFGTRHPDTATSYNNVGLAYGELGNHKKALEYKIKALEIMEELLGTRHPDTATSYNNVGCEYGKLGNHKKALEYEIKALEIREELFGTRHPDTATSYNNVGLAYGGLGNHKKALEYEIKALKIMEELFGTRHPDTATSYNNVGYEYGELGNHKKALEYEIKAMKIREELLGTRHPDTATSYNNVGWEYNAAGNHQNALEYKLKALAIQEEILGNNHLDTAISYSNIGVEYIEMGQFQEGIQYRQLALSIAESLNDEKNAAIFHNRLAKSYKAAGDIDKAREHYFKASELFKKLKMLEDFESNNAEMKDL